MNVPIARAGAALGLLVVTVWLTLAAGTPNDARWRLLGLVGLCWAAFALAVWSVLRVRGRAAVGLVLAGAVVLQVVAVAFPPRSTDDFYRYVWDGRVQASGTDPYRYAPVDPALESLRDPWLFPPECRDAVPPCTRMNHPTDPTIYPPVAQFAFLGLHVVTRPLGDDGGGPRPLQLLAAALALATTLVLMRVLRRVRGGDQRQAALWAWCPTVVLEAGNNAHIDVLAALLLVVALGAAAAGRFASAGLAIGAAIATKLLPVLALPALLASLPRDGSAAAWRRWARGAAPLLLACLAVLVAGYAPHVLAVGGRALGFLPAYLDEEGYQGGGRFALLRLVLPGEVAVVVGVLLIGAVAVWTARPAPPAAAPATPPGVDHALRDDHAIGDDHAIRARPLPWRPAVVLVGFTFALAAVPYPWYALLLVALVALDGRWEWLAVAAAAYPVYFIRALDLPLTATQQVSYGTAAALVVLVVAGRAKRGAAMESWTASGGERPRARRGAAAS